MSCLVLLGGRRPFVTGEMGDVIICNNQNVCAFSVARDTLRIHYCEIMAKVRDVCRDT